MTTTTDKLLENDTDPTDTDPVATDAEPAAEESDTETTEPVRSGSRLRRALQAVGALAVVGIVAAAAFPGWTLWQQNQVSQAADQAQQAAVEYAQVLTSIDAARVDENFDQVLDGATGDFKDMYSQSSMQLRQLLIDNKASAHGVVVESAVQSATKDRAVVLLFVDQSVSNASVPDPRLDRSRIKMTMQNVDGRWRAAQVELP
ncbi:DUF3329 domain-containing protein [Mycolicibacterium mengxianglii]|uniref:DUF3329 domain-containing protein n=1 Tax=Mycolicibacterium mengxianglii TaxID=2736649 RepID=UPI0018D143FF|nr:DUF3329 domain-containing protein [Mycolicibacterium mengxianglii]